MALTSCAPIPHEFTERKCEFYCFGGIFVLFSLPSDPDDLADPALAAAVTPWCDTLWLVVINVLLL